MPLIKVLRERKSRTRFNRSGMEIYPTTLSLGCVMAEVLTGRRLFETYYGDRDQGILTILSVLCVPDEEAWPGFLDTPFATKRRKELMNCSSSPTPTC
jgi:hypothetical protein